MLKQFSLIVPIYLWNGQLIAYQSRRPEPAEKKKSFFDRHIQGNSLAFVKYSLLTLILNGKWKLFPPVGGPNAASIVLLPRTYPVIAISEGCIYAHIWSYKILY